MSEKIANKCQKSYLCILNGYSMFIFNLVLILFLVVVTILLIALVLVRRIMVKVKRTVGSAFSSKERHFDDRTNTVNEKYKKKSTIRPNDGEYVDFEEIKE